MPQLHSLTVKKCGLLRDVTFPFKKGLTFLGGRNMDRDSKSANAVGKSMLWSLLGGMIFQEQLWATTGVRNTNRQLLGTVALSFSVGESRYDLFQKSTGVKVDYRLSKDGTPLDLHTLKNKVAAIEELLPLNREHFISTVYVGGDSTPLLRGSSTERIAFFSNLWDFETYEKMQRFFRSKRADLKEELTRLNVHREELENLPEDNQEQLSEDLKRVKKKGKSLRRNIDEVRAEIKEIGRHLEVFSLRPEKDRAYCEKRLKKLLPQQKEYDLFSERMAAWEEYDRKKRKLESRLTHTEKPEDRTSSLSEDRESDLREAVSFWSEHRKDYDRLKDYWDTRIPEPMLDEDRRSFLADWESAKDDLAAARSGLSSLKSLQKSGERKCCPTCQQKITPAIIRETLKGLEESVDRHEERCLRFEAQKLYWKFSHVLSIDLSAAKKELREIEREGQEYERNLRLWQEDEAIRENLSLLTPVDRPSGDARDHSEEIESLQRCLVQDKLFRERAHPDLSEEQLLAQRKPLKEELDSLTEELEDNTEQERSLFADLRVATGRAERRKTLAESVGTIPAVQLRLDMVAKLYDWFSPRGVQQSYMQTIIGAYVDNLNQFYGMILDNPPEFSFFLEDKSFDILAKRNGNTTDIRTFSKSEGKQFCAISALAIRAILPDEYVLDTLILDEVEEGMSAFERELYVSRFLPFAATIVDKVVVVTPHLAIKDSLEGRAYVMERKRNETRLVPA